MLLVRFARVFPAVGFGEDVRETWAAEQRDDDAVIGEGEGGGWWRVGDGVCECVHSGTHRLPLVHFARYQVVCNPTDAGQVPDPLLSVTFEVLGRGSSSVV